jgi:hypothetical protein
MKMKKQIVLLLTIAVLSVNAYSQNTFEKGYFINNNDQKTECLIKNKDWKSNPSDFEYKVSENSEINIVDIKSAKEFGIYTFSKYVRSTVKLDKSSENINDLSTEKEPAFVEELLFLKVLVEGKSNLYHYLDSNLQRFFYNKENSNIEPLVYKKYLPTPNRIEDNNQFKKQLWIDLKCPTIGVNTLESLRYQKNSLIDFFVKYNNCNNSEVVKYERKENKNLFHLTLNAHLNSSSLSVYNSTFTRNKTTEFGPEMSLGFGVEAEYIFPFNNNKWSVFIEPTYQYFNSEKITDDYYVPEKKIVSTVAYSSIEVPIGIRHYFFLKNNSKLFVNAAYVFDFNFKSTLELYKLDSYYNSLVVSSLNNMAFGVGYKFKEKYRVETRYETSRTIIGSYIHWTSSYSTFSVLLGYSLF